MKKREFFLKALQAKAYQSTPWVIALFAITKPKDPIPAFYPHRDGKQVYFMDPEGEKVVIEDAPLNGPLCHLREAIDLGINDLPNVINAVKTTYGNCVINAMVIADAFGEKIPFITGKIDLKKHIEKKVFENYMDANLPEEKKITLEEYLVFRNNASVLETFTQIAVPAASRQALTGHPDRYKIRDKLIEENKGKIDPIVVAKIAKELEKLDREWIADSPSAGFYISDKSYQLTRARLFYMMGMESGGSNAKDLSESFIQNSLEEGMKIEHAVNMFNNMRLGSYQRGIGTALGGVIVKLYLQAFMNTFIEGDDCGTQAGADIYVTFDRYPMLVGFYHQQGAKAVLMDDAYAKAQVGKTIKVRLPSHCATAGENICKVCAGELNTLHPNALAEQTSAVGSTHLGIFMSAMHGNALKLGQFDLREAVL